MTNASTASPSVRLPSFGVQVLLGMVAGLALGLIARNLGSDSGLALALQTTGQLFVQLLKALVPPLVFTAIVASIAALRGLSNASRLVAQTLLWFAITALIAVAIGILLGVTIQPGLHAGVDPASAATPSSTARGSIS